MMKFLVILAALSLLSAACASAPSASAGATQVADPKAEAASGETFNFEGFEDSAVWVAVAGSWKDGNQSTDAKIVSGRATEGSKSLECSYTFVNDPAKKGASWMTEDILKKNWTGVTAVLIDIDNTSGKDLEFDLGVCTGDAWDWMETQLVKVPAGLNKGVRFDLTNVKSNLTKWAWGGKVENPNSVQRVVVQLINGPAQGDSGKIYLDNLRLVKSGL